MFPLQRFHEAQGPTLQCRHGGLLVRPTQDSIVLHWQRNDEADPHLEKFPRDDSEYDPAFRAEIGDFVAWIQHDRRPRVTWLEGLRCVEMMEAAYTSANGGGTLVTVRDRSLARTVHCGCWLCRCYYHC